MWRSVVLREVWLFRYVTSALVARGLCWNRKVAQRRLRVLALEGLLDRFRVDARRGFGEWWYRLSRSGARLVGELEGLELGVVLPPKRRPRSLGFLSHHAEVLEFRLWLREACVDGFSCQFVPEFEEAGGRRRVAWESPDGVLVPDGAFVLERNSRPALFLLEVDRGTEPFTGGHRSSIARKLLRYRSLFDSRGYSVFEELFERSFTGFRVLCVVPDVARQSGFLRLAEREDLVPLVWVAVGEELGELGSLDLSCWKTSVSCDGRCLGE